jgi:cytochrome c peroxidase
MKWNKAGRWCAACLAWTLVAILAATGRAPNAQDALQAEAGKLFGGLETAARYGSAETQLGRALFWDERLSADGRTACASCHSAEHWGADRRRASIDARGRPTSRQSPTVFNAMSQPTLRWLGDRRTGADQAEGSITGSMGFAAKEDIIPLLRAFGYEVEFRAAFPHETEPVSTRSYGRAIEAYETTLVTPAPFDRFIGGDASALDARQRAGLRLFMERGCAGCHNGALLGGSALRRFGVVKDYWLATGSARLDTGRYAVTRSEEDRYVFRVPMLRNIARTAPYFHDGSVATLDAAVQVMATVQLGQTLSDHEVGSIVAFLESLTGDVPGHYAPPARTPSGSPLAP